MPGFLRSDTAYGFRCDGSFSQIKHAGTTGNIPHACASPGPRHALLALLVILVLVLLLLVLLLLLLVLLLLVLFLLLLVLVCSAASR